MKKHLFLAFTCLIVIVIVACSKHDITNQKDTVTEKERFQMFETNNKDS